MINRFVDAVPLGALENMLANDNSRGLVMSKSDSDGQKAVAAYTAYVKPLIADKRLPIYVLSDKYIHSDLEEKIKKLVGDVI